mmetsp:Transcript_1710/g.2459  ORF Transcript_1710/g.2459 Transcript_1710/m.2459 type:complete len:259 (+) Transcript_1710:31-807(+)
MGKGKLMFKGEKAKKKKKSKHSKRTTSNLNERLSQDLTEGKLHQKFQDENNDQGALEENNESSKIEEIQSQPKVMKGSGVITSSGNVITGHKTKFESCLNVGDAILVNIPISQSMNDVHQSMSSTDYAREEMRIITMRLSDTSAAISSSFSSDIRYPLSFEYISKPRDLQHERAKKQLKDINQKQELDRSVFGTYADKSSDIKDGHEGREGREHQLVYRERTEHGSYRIRKESIFSEKALSRSDLLEKRSTKKSDRYC